MAANIKPFSIAVPDAELQRLKAKLSLASFPDEVSFSDDWDYGVPLKDTKRLAAYWKDGYEWRRHEAELNKLPQFSTSVAIDGFDELDIHYIHQKSEDPNAIPLLFCHGWPGGFWEAQKLLPLLTAAKPGQPSFHVVVPSLPNYGFSSAPSKPGFSISQYAEVAHQLMLQLGYPTYATQGGDWGWAITRTLGILHPTHLLASHVNLILSKAPKPTAHPLLFLQSLLPHSPAEKAGLARTASFHRAGYGYNVLQSTKPHTLGFALADSPVALLAWVYEKLHDWTDGYPWTDDEVLTWVSLYVFARSGPAASVRIYYEAAHGVDAARERAKGWNGRVAMGLSYFPRDLSVLPRVWGRTLGPVVFEKAHESGGHFAAFEKPEELAEDVRTMFKAGGELEKKWAARK